MCVCDIGTLVAAYSHSVVNGPLQNDAANVPIYGNFLQQPSTGGERDMHVCTRSYFWFAWETIT